MNTVIRRTALSIGAALAVSTAAAIPAHAAPPPDDIGRAIHCGFLNGLGVIGDLIDPTCRQSSRPAPSYSGGIYYGNAACHQAGRNAVANHRARSFYCSLLSGPSGKYKLTLNR